MQDGNAIPTEGAGEWLRKNAEKGVSITLIPAKSDPAAYREIQEILFGPEGVSQAT